jgi:hypothetical protein
MGLTHHNLKGYSRLRLLLRSVDYDDCEVRVCENEPVPIDKSYNSDRIRACIDYIHVLVETIIDMTQAEENF